ncbi:MerR family transcriptional regulator [Cellulomonas sp. McL0617]|uniref:MerR family transcriptional regulator n=1 Tax=Cellulomonas sp. McL0617 TaxID=3415675 RepID=UPI003CF37D92
MRTDEPVVSIGDFSRMTYLTVKALRHYQEVGILVPWRVDPGSGYRSYHLSQVSIAQVIKRLRDLEMPLESVRAVVEAPDIDARNRAIAVHLAHMEDQLAQTRGAVSALRSLLQDAAPNGGEVEFRDVPALWALTIRESLALTDASAWARPAYRELHGALRELVGTRAGVDGALFSADVFEQGIGELVAFVPVAGPTRLDRLGRVRLERLPRTELAIMVHRGSGADLDRTYADLGAFVAAQAIGVAGPIWENFTVTGADTDVVADRRTEVGWPVFRTSR